MKPDCNELIQKYLDGRISPEEMKVLNDQLRHHADARLQFLNATNLDSGLAGLLQGTDVSISATSPTVAGTRRKLIRSWSLQAGLCCVLFVGVLLFWLNGSRTCAMVKSATGVQGISSRSHLNRDWYEIQQGTLDLVTVKGVQLVIEAPARFRFESAQRLHLSSGRLAADVPTGARKFTVVTPTGEAVDLGTKFGVDVSASGESEIHVFQGEVIAQSTQGTARQNLYDGEAFRLKRESGGVRDFRSAAFIRPDEVASLHAALKAGQPLQSNSVLEQLKSDSALIALLDFESEVIPSGTYNLVQGRWPGSHAPEFLNVGDHMKLNVGEGQEWSQLTLAVWVRLDRFGEPYQSLLHTDGWDTPTKLGQVHWMVTNHRTMRLALFGNQMAPGQPGDRTYADSITPIPDKERRWVHLAAVYDSQEKTARFYLDGVLDNVARHDVAHPARLGPAQIGNWNDRDRKLSGRMDELVILGRALSDGEVSRLYEAGNPYR